MESGQPRPSSPLTSWEHEHATEELALTDGPDRRGELREIRELIQRAFASLPPDHRAAIMAGDALALVRLSTDLLDSLTGHQREAMALVGLTGIVAELRLGRTDRKRNGGGA